MEAKTFSSTLRYIYICTTFNTLKILSQNSDSFAKNLALTITFISGYPFSCYTVCMVSKCNLPFKYDQNYRFTQVQIISQIYNIDMMLALFVNKQC